MPSDSEVSFVPMTAVEEESGRLDATQIRTLDSVRKGYTQFRENDVVFAKITPCMENGKIALATGLTNGLAYGSTELVVFRPHNGLLPRFVLHFLLRPSFRENAAARMTGVVGQKRVPLNYLANHEFLLPPTREQERIVAKLGAALSGVDRAESAVRRAQVRLHRYRAAVIDAAITGELTRDWRNAQKKATKGTIESGDALLRRLLNDRRDRWEKVELQRIRSKGSEPRNSKWRLRLRESAPPNTHGLPKLPSGWSWASIDQLSWASGYGTSIKCSRDGDGPAVLRIPNVRGRTFAFDDLKFATSSHHFDEDAFVAPGDLLVIRTNGSKSIVGRAAVITAALDERYSFASYLIRFRLVGDDAIWPWVSLAWDSDIVRTSIESKAVTTAGQYNVSMSRLFDVAIPLPPTDEIPIILREVARRMTGADRLESTLQTQLTRAGATRRSLLDEAFTGRLVEQDPNDEPALVMLERMRAETILENAERKQVRRRRAPLTMTGSDSMEERMPTPESLRDAWERMGGDPNARRLFDEAGFSSDQVVQFYEALRMSPDVLAAFQDRRLKTRKRRTPPRRAKVKAEVSSGRFRLIAIWLEEFKNLKDYTVFFNPAQALDVVLGWNGTGKSNLFEALVIVFRDLHEWWEKNRWPDKPMNGFRLSYEIDDQTVEIVWLPGQMKRPEVRKGPILRTVEDREQFEAVKRDQLSLPRFVFGYYSGPTNRLAEHFLPMKQAHYVRLREAEADDAKTLAKLLEQRRFFCAETHHAKYVLLAFSYKEDAEIGAFLRDRLRILGFESALFVIRKPRWAKPGSTADDFWGATGIMRRVMERLRRYAIAPMILEQDVAYGYRSTTEDHFYFFLPDLASLHAFAAEYEDARTFFLALESTDFSELIHDVKIQVRIKATSTHQLPITFHQLSEGEQQLLMVLGLMRFTKSHQSLILLDEPDTHLNPHWSVDYLKDLTRVMSDNTLESPEQQSSQILMATHDPLVIASLVKEQIHLLKRDPETAACKWSSASVNPRGLGFTGILTSEMFGFRSDLDPETLADLDTRVRLVAKEEMTVPEKEELERIDKRLVDAGFSKAFSDPYYAAFVRAWGRRHSELMAGLQFLTPEKRQEIDRIASEVLKEAIAEVEKGAGV